MIKRSEYLKGNVDFQTYYSQFVTPEILSLVIRRIGLGAINHSTDMYFCNIPLVKWDNLHPAIILLIGDKIKEANNTGGISLSDTICIAKAAASIIKENNKQV